MAVEKMNVKEVKKTKKQLKKDKRQHTIWRLEQMVNFGLDGGKLNASELKKNWLKLHIDPKKKSFLFQLLWPARRF